MPYAYTVDVPVSEVINKLVITSFAVDISRQEIHVGYDLGSDVDATFVATKYDQVHTIDGPGFAAAIAAADVYANAMPVGSVSVYGALKLALYDEIASAKGLTGTVI